MLVSGAGLSVKRWISGAGSSVKLVVSGADSGLLRTPERSRVRAGRSKPAVGGDETT